MRKLLVSLALLVFVCSGLSSAELPVAPALDNVEREKGDGGFSRGFGDTNHAWSFDWFDSHLHLAYSHFPNLLEGQQIRHSWITGSTV